VSLDFAPANQDDWPKIWPLWHEVVVAGDTYTFDPGCSMDDAAKIWLPGSPAQTWSVRDDADPADDTVLGTYLLKPNQTGNGAHVANAGFMVGAVARGRGVGRAMGEHCLHQARADGYLGMQFNAVVATNTNAIALWRALGFATVGTVPRAFRHPVHGLVDLHIMYRDL
jgi:GNAT superfamily N-acetyltransferase